MALFPLGLAGLYRSPALIAALEPLDLATARLTAGVLSGLGVAVERTGPVLSHPGGFSYEIYYRCTGLVVAALMAAGIAALPGRSRAKAVGIAIGALLVAGVNLARLVGLFVIGVEAPWAFDFAHRVAGEALMLGTIFAVWIGWMRWTPCACSLPSPPPSPSPLPGRAKSPAARPRSPSSPVS
jgi:exosortase/archaeosortase family protein